MIFKVCLRGKTTSLLFRSGPACVRLCYSIISDETKQLTPHMVLNVGFFKLAFTEPLLVFCYEKQHFFCSHVESYVWLIQDSWCGWHNHKYQTLAFRLYLKGNPRLLVKAHSSSAQHRLIPLNEMLLFPLPPSDQSTKNRVISDALAGAPVQGWASSILPIHKSICAATSERCWGSGPSLPSAESGFCSLKWTLLFVQVTSIHTLTPNVLYSF